MNKLHKLRFSPHFILILLLMVGVNSCYNDNRVAADDSKINRFVTYNYTIKATDWVGKIGDISTYLYKKTMPDITSGVISNGIVLTYARFDGDAWVQLPMTNHYTDKQGVPYTLEYLPYFTVNTYELRYVDSHPQPLPPNMFTELRVVVVEGTDYINSLHNVDKNNYDNVIENLNTRKKLLENAQKIID